MMPGLVSTIIPVFNRPRQLGEAVASVLAQDWRPIEVIVVDDGSTDRDTLSVARGLEAAHPGVVRVLTQPNGGPGRARETGRLAARGEYVQYLDSDDVLLPGKFLAQVRALEAMPEADVAYGITLFRHADGTLVPMPHKGTGIARVHMFPDFLNERWWDTSTPLYRRRVTDRAGPWLALALEEDWEYDCRVAATGGRLAHVPAPVSETRDHASGRLCVGAALDPRRVAARAEAQQRIWRHAQRAGLPTSAPAHVARFARSLFLLARQCGAAGCTAESVALLSTAAEAEGAVSIASRDLRLYRRLERLFGAKFVGRMSLMLDRWRSAT